MASIIWPLASTPIAVQGTWCLALTRLPRTPSLEQGPVCAPLTPPATPCLCRWGRMQPQHSFRMMHGLVARPLRRGARRGCAGGEAPQRLPHGALPRVCLAVQPSLCEDLQWDQSNMRTALSPPACAWHPPQQSCNMDHTRGDLRTKNHGRRGGGGGANTKAHGALPDFRPPLEKRYCCSQPLPSSRMTFPPEAQPWPHPLVALLQIPCSPFVFLKTLGPVNMLVGPQQRGPSFARLQHSTSEQDGP